MNRFGVWAYFCALLSCLTSQVLGQSPAILTQPQEQIASSGDSVSFSVQASGALPLFYQWQANQTNIVGATTAALSLTDLHIFQAGDYRVVVSNAVGSVTSQVARLLIDNDLVFRITGLLTNGLITLEHEQLTGDDRGGIAVSPSHVFYTGDSSTARWNIEYLTAGTSLGTRHEAMVTDLRTSTVYSLANGSTPLAAAGIISSLIQIDGTTGQLTGNRIDLSGSITNSGTTGIFAGYGRVVIYTGGRVYSVAVPSGVVTDLGPIPGVTRLASENWAFWGIAEYVGGSVYLVYVRDGQSIVRTRVPGGSTTVIATFTSPSFFNGLSDMASIGFSVPYSRWYFHHENSSMLRTVQAGLEVLGSAKALYTVDPNPPFITRDPSSRNIYPGDSTELDMAVSGAAPLSYQWRLNGTNIAGETNSTLILANAEPTTTGNYSVEVSNSSGSAVSADAFVFVISIPEVLSGPFDVGTFAGTNVTFFAQWRAAPPETFQWYFNGTAIVGATNPSLTLSNAAPNQSGLYTLQVSNRYGIGISRPAQLFVFAPQDDGSVFRVRNFLTNNFRIRDTYSLTRNQLQTGPLAVSPNQVFFTGSQNSSRISAEDLTGGTDVGAIYHGLVSNLRTEQCYVLATDSGPLGANGGTITRLLEIDNTTGALNGRFIRLSQPLSAVANGGQPGVFSGYGRMALHDGAHTYLIYLPSGQVVDMGPLNAFQHSFAQGWAHYGIVEHVGGIPYLVYARNSQSIVRTRVPDGFTTVINTFQNISFYMSLNVSVPRNRWYFHILFNSQFSNLTQTLGSAPVELDIDLGQSVDHFDWSPISRLQQTNVPFLATLTAKNSRGETLTNFSGSLNLRGFNVANGSAVTVTPSTLSSFTNGSWTGLIQVLQITTGMQLQASDGSGATGTSPELVVAPQDDLVLLVTDSPDPAVLGEQVTYSLLVTNTGPGSATSVTLTNAVPNGFAFEAISTSQGSCVHSNGTIKCDLGTLNGAGAVLHVRGVAARLGMVTNRFGVTRGESDASVANNSAVELTSVTLPRVSIADVSYVEGDSGTNDLTITITLSGPATNTVQVGYTTANGTAVGSGTLRDFLVASGNAVFAPGTTSQSVVVRVRGDILYEGDEFFLFQLFAPNGAVLEDNEARVTIINDDIPPTVTVSDVVVTEGNTGTSPAAFTVVLSGVSGVAIPVMCATSNGTASAGSDFIGQTNTLTFNANSGVLTQVFNVAVIGDAQPEMDETFSVLITVTNAPVARSVVTGTISNDEGEGILNHFTWGPLPNVLTPSVPFPVTLTAQDFFGATLSNFNGMVGLQAFAGQPLIARRIVGDRMHDQVQPQGSFTIGYSFIPTNNIRVTHFRHYAGTRVSVWTTGGTVLASRAVTGPDGAWSETPLLTPLDLTAGQEYVVGYFGGGQGYYWLDDVLTEFPNGTIGNGRAIEGDNYPAGDNGPILFLVDLIYLSGAPPAPVPVSPGTSGSFTNGTWSGLLTITNSITNVFLRAESDPQHSGVSSTFDVIPLEDVRPVVTIQDTSIVEGDTGTNDVLIEVRLSSPSTKTVQVSYTTANGTAVSSGVNRDFLSRSGTLSFPPGTTNQTIMVPVRGDTSLEQDETFLLQLFSPVNAVIADNEAEVRITNDDAPPSVLVRNASVVEGNSGVTNASFQVVLSASSGFGILVDYATSNNTALAGQDYVERTGRLTFVAGTTVRTQVVEVAVRGDRMGENDESFFLHLVAVTNATISSAQATGTIVNDDLGGVANELVWSAIPSNQYAHRPINVTIRAQDAFGNLASNFTDMVDFSAHSYGDVPGRSILRQVPHSLTLADGPSTDGYAFTPRTNLLVTHFRHYSGSKISLWTDQGSPLAIQEVTSEAGTWGESPLLRPVQLLAGRRYRLGVFTETGHNFGRADLPSDRGDVVVAQSYSTAGDGFLLKTNGVRWPLVDLVYTIGNVLPLPISPNKSSAFVAGVWTGDVTVTQPGRYVVLEAAGTNGLVGSSTVFQVSVSNDVSLVLTAPADSAILGQPFAYQLLVHNTGPGSASGVTLTNVLPEAVTFLSATSSVGMIFQGDSVVRWEMGDLAGGASATLTIQVVANLATGTLINRAGVFSAAPDPLPANNNATVEITAVSAIINPSFETGDFTGWIAQDLSSTYLPMQVRTDGYTPGFGFFASAATDGTYSATHGFVGGNAGTIVIAQDVFVPASRPVLSFDYRAAWQMFGGSMQATFDVRIEPTGGGTPLLVNNLATVLPLAVNPDTGPQNGLIDLTAFAGSAVRINFAASVPESFIGPGYVQLDNVNFVRAEERPPNITLQPQSQSVSSAVNVTFAVGVNGSQPMSFQWFYNQTPVVGGTNGSLVLPLVSFLQAGEYYLVASNAFGIATSDVARLQVDVDLFFRIVSLDTNGVRGVDHNALTGDDRGGIAVSDTHLFYTGDGSNNRIATGRFNIDDLSGGTVLSSGYDALIGDLRTETIFSLGNGTSPIQYSNSVLNFGSCNSLLQINGETGGLTGQRIILTTNIDLTFAGSIGLFAGYGRVVIHNGLRAYNIALPSGLVTDLGSMPFFDHSFTENWAYWGIAEFFQDAVHLIYVEDNTRIVRRRVPDNSLNTLLSVPFGNGLADMASITFSISRARWFFHHEGSSVLRNGNEVVGSAKASFTFDPGFPLITSFSSDQVVSAGDEVVLSVAATGAGALAYRWYHNGTLVPGATNATLSFTGIGSADAGAYQVEVSNELGFLRSPAAQLNVLSFPTIFQSPFSASVLPGTNVHFQVSVLGAAPLRFQWRFNGQSLPGATNDSLSLTNVRLADSGLYSVVISNQFGFAVSDDAVLSVVRIIDDGSVFRIASLAASGSRVVDHNAITGDDRGGIAASSTHVFVTGDNRTGRYALDDLSGGVVVGSSPYDALVSDLQSERMYTLANGTTIFTGNGRITSLLEFNPDGQLSGRRIDLSQPIDLLGFSDQIGIFAGYGRIVLLADQNVFSVSLPSGRVTLLGILPFFSHNTSESWAFWGVAEQAGGLTHLVYASGSAIMRTRVPDGHTEVVQQFNSLSDMASMTVSVSRQRWYFHYEGGAQFGGTTETLGYCDATFEIKAGSSPARFVWEPIGRVQLVDQPFLATLTAVTASNNIATNFDGSVDLRGLNLATAGSVQVSPSVISNFVAGVWTGLLTIRTPVPSLQIVGEDTSGAQGVSGEFSVSPSNDLVVVVEDQPDPVFAGEVYTYTITVTNIGPSDATAVLLTNLLPAQAGYSSATSSQGSCTRNGAVIRCDLGTITAAGSVAIRIDAVAPNAAVMLTNRTTIVRGEVDALPGNNNATVVTSVLLPVLSVGDITYVEGNSGTNDVLFTVSLSGRSTNNIQVGYTTANGTAVASGSQRDYLARSGTLTFAPGVSNQTIAVPIRGDSVFEADETLLLQIFAAVGATISDNEGVGTIINDDAAPSVQVTDAQVLEGLSGITEAVLTVQLSEVSGLPVVVRYGTSNGTAVAGSDFVATQGTLTFSANSAVLTQSLSISVVGDRLAESNEFFHVFLSVSNGVATSDRATITIISDDGAGFLDHFAWSLVSSPQQPNAPFAVQIEARDFMGAVVTNYNGAASIRAGIGSGTDSTIVISEIDPNNLDAAEFMNVSPTTIDISGYDIVVYDPTVFPAPRVTFTVPNGVSVLPGGIFLLTEAGTAPGAYPNFRAGVNISWVTSITNNETAVLLLDANGNPVDFFCAVDAFPEMIADPLLIQPEVWSGRPTAANTDNTRSFQRVGNRDRHDSSDWLVAVPSMGLINSNLSSVFAEGFRPLVSSPTNGVTFVNGTWAGLVTVGESATNALLRITDTAGHRGDSMLFDVRVVPAADVALMMSATPNPAVPGSNIVYVLTVTNRGPSSATEVVLTNWMPAGFEYITASSSQGAVVSSNGTVTAVLGTVAVLQAVEVRITLRPHAVGSYTNIAVVNASSADPTLVNNYANVTCTVWLDADGDGMPDAWEQQYNLNPNNAADALLDADADGQNNLDEFKSGTNPQDANSVMRITNIVVVGGDVRMQFHGVLGRTYRLERLDGTNPDRWTTVLVFQTGSSANVQIVDTGGAGRPTMIYRISLLR